MSDSPQVIHVHINLGAGPIGKPADASGLPGLEIGKGTFRVYQGANLDQLCAFVRSEGLTSDEQWIWISGLTNNAVGGDSSRVYLEPGSSTTVRLKFVRYDFPGVTFPDIPTFTDWRAAVKDEVNPDPLHPHFLLTGVQLASSTFVP